MGRVKDFEMEASITMEKFSVDKRIKKELKEIVKVLNDKFKGDLSALLLYGSWAKGRAREDSDIDLLVVFKNKRKDLAKEVYRLIARMNSGREISLVSTSVEEFKNETLPLFTAVKKEGRVIYGKVDLAVNLTPPEGKYRDFFRKSRKFEREKIKTAEYLMRKGMSSGISQFCYLASKHAIQAGLAMEGVGFSSKFCMLVRWAERYFGEDLSKAFRFLFRLHVKSEYKMQSLSKRENSLAIKEAKRILNRVYSQWK